MKQLTLTSASAVVIAVILCWEVSSYFANAPNNDYSTVTLETMVSAASPIYSPGSTISQQQCLMTTTTLFSFLHDLGHQCSCFIYPQKSRILTSCNGSSIIPLLQQSNPTLATTITDAINTYSTTTSNNITNRVELTDGFRLLVQLMSLS